MSDDLLTTITCKASKKTDQKTVKYLDLEKPNPASQPAPESMAKIVN